MGHHARSRRTGFRRAVAGSVAVHAVAAVIVVLVVRTREVQPRTPAAGIDTRVSDVVVRMFPEEPPEPVPVVVATEPPREPDPPRPDPTPPAAVATERPDTEGSRPPLVQAVPHALPAGVLNAIRRPRNPVTDPNVRPAAALAARPLHGSMKPGQVVVYALDCSGSMGEFGKFAAARDALIATLHRQPREVRFQVICYNSTARAILPGGCAAATPANVAAAEAGLATLAPSGRSNHTEAVRAAAALRPDVILLLTDAEELSAAALRPALAGGPVPVWVARTAAGGVGQPRELR